MFSLTNKQTNNNNKQCLTFSSVPCLPLFVSFNLCFSPLSLRLSVWLSEGFVCLSVCLCLCLCFCLSVPLCLSASVSVCLSGPSLSPTPHPLSRSISSLGDLVRLTGRYNPVSHSITLSLSLSLKPKISQSRCQSVCLCLRLSLLLLFLSRFLSPLKSSRGDNHVSAKELIMIIKIVSEKSSRKEAPSPS